MKSIMKKMRVLLLSCTLVLCMIQPVTTQAKGVQIDLRPSAQTFIKSHNTQVEPKFKSGGSTHTHQYIVTQALAILRHDKGYSLLNQSSNASTLKTYTDWPDKVGNESDSATYVGHFYNPYTEKSWTGSKSKTAMVRAMGYFNDALAAVQEGNMEDALVLIGKGTHYVSDMNEPHHASNLTAVNSNHSAFEKYVDENRTSFYITGNTLDESYYQETAQVPMSQILRNGAYYAYDLKYMAQEESTYFEAGKLSVQHAIINVVQYLYEFGEEAGIYS